MGRDKSLRNICPMFLVSARLIAARCCCCCCRGLHQDREQPTTRSARESRVKATSPGKSSISVRKVESEFLGRRSGTELNWKLVFLLSGDLVLGRSCCSELVLSVHCLQISLGTGSSTARGVRFVVKRYTRSARFLEEWVVRRPS